MLRNMLFYEGVTAKCYAMIGITRTTQPTNLQLMKTVYVVP